MITYLSRSQQSRYRQLCKKLFIDICNQLITFRTPSSYFICPCYSHMCHNLGFSTLCVYTVCTLSETVLTDLLLGSVMSIRVQLETSRLRRYPPTFETYRFRQNWILGDTSNHTLVIQNTTDLEFHIKYGFPSKLKVSKKCPIKLNVLIYINSFCNIE